MKRVVNILMKYITITVAISWVVILICIIIVLKNDFKKTEEKTGEVLLTKKLIDSLVYRAYIKGQVDFMTGDVRIKADTINNQWILTKSPYKR